MEDLKSLREKIDSIDKQLINLLEERMDLVSGVAAYKKINNIPTLNQSREEDVLLRARNLTKNEDYKDSVVATLKSLMSISRSYQNRQNHKGCMDDLKRQLDENLDLNIENPKVIYQGIEGSFSFEALNKHFDNCEYSNRENFEDVFKSIANGDGDYGVLPIENSSTGSINDIYDLLNKYNCYIVGEEIVKIDQNLYGTKGSNLSDIKEIYSHPQGFAQCSSYLEDKDNIRLIPYKNTAMSAKLISDNKDKSKAAICSKNAGEIYKLDCIAQCINDVESNCTRFIIVSNRLEYTKKSNKISIMFALPHLSGKLNEVLSTLAINGLNMLKIESRPSREKEFEYLFYIDFEGNALDEKVRKALEHIWGDTVGFRFMGCY